MHSPTSNYSDIVATATRLSKLKQRSFLIEETLIVENWLNSNITNFPYLISTDHVSFKITITKSDADKTLICVSSCDIIGTCDVSVNIKIINNLNEKSKNLKISNNFTFSRWHRDILIDMQVPASHLNEASGFVLDNKLKFRVKIAHFNHKNKLATQPEFVPYVGLRNQGATCYMNSVLQAMFHIPQFQRIIYQMNTKSDKSDDHNISLNLQRLFAKMKLSSSACSTKDLTRSFGWNIDSIFVEHDVQEFCNVLLDNISSFIPNDGLSIMRGHSKSIFKCRNVDFTTSKEEEFYDLAVPVKDFSKLEDALMTFKQTDPLIGENQYQTPEFGLQDADKGFEFIDMPPILRIHLKRFIYNGETKRNEKLNSFFAFPIQLDMSPIVNQPDQNYELISVLVHSGTSVSGHYIAYIRPTVQEQWYEFDDSKVTKVPISQAIDNNFGAEDDESRFFSAYLLVYARKNNLEELFKPITNDEIPPNVVSYIEERALNRENKRLSDLKAKNTVEISFILPSNIIENASHGVLSLCGNNNSVTVKADDTYNKIYQKCAEQLKTDPETITLWTIVDDHLHQRLERSDQMNVKNLDYNHSLYVQDANEDTDNEYIVFIFTYFPNVRPPLRFMFSYMMNKSDSFSAIYPIYREIAKLPENVPFTVFYRSIDNNTEIEKAEDPDDSLNEYDLKNGAMVIIQPTDTSTISLPEIKIEPPLKPHFNYLEHYMTTFPPDVIDYNRIRKDTISLKISEAPKIKKVPLFTFPARITFSDFKKFVAHCLQIDYFPPKEHQNGQQPNQYDQIGNLCFFKPMSLTPIIADENILMYRMLARLKNEFVTELTLYHFETFPEYPLSEMLRIACFVSLDSLDNGKEFTLIMSSKCTTRDLLRKVIQNKWIDAKLHQIRLIQLASQTSEIDTIIDLDILLSKIHNPVRVELIPDDQLFGESTDILIRVVAYNPKNVDINHNFYLKLIDDELFEFTKERIRETLGWTEEQIKGKRFTLEGEQKKTRTLKDKTLLTELYTEPLLSLIIRDNNNFGNEEANKIDESIKFFN